MASPGDDISAALEVRGERFEIQVWGKGQFYYLIDTKEKEIMGTVFTFGAPGYEDKIVALKARCEKYNATLRSSP